MKNLKGQRKQVQITQHQKLQGKLERQLLRYKFQPSSNQSQA